MASGINQGYGIFTPMNFYHVPSPVRGILLDIDGTLYDNPAYIEKQATLFVSAYANHRGLELESAREQIEAYRREFARNHDGRRPSMGNTFLALGVSMKESAKWREEVLAPERFLAVDEQLRRALETLTRACRIVAVTNNPVSTARRTLSALGVEELLPRIVGLDTCYASKPDAAPFREAQRLLDVPFGSCVSVGDRYEIDIEPALTLGAGGVLVTGVSEVYGLPELLCAESAAEAERGAQ